MRKAKHDALVLEQQNYLDFVTAETPYRAVKSWDKSNARAELASLRATVTAQAERIASQEDSLRHWQNLWGHIQNVTGCDYLSNAANFDAMFSERIAALKQSARDARQQLRATSENWREDCLFNADDILTKAIGDAPEPAPISAAEQDMIDSWHDRL
jgi:hypothetical protein